MVDKGCGDTESETGAPTELDDFVLEIPYEILAEGGFGEGRVVSVGKVAEFDEEEAGEVIEAPGRNLMEFVARLIGVGFDEGDVFVDEGFFVGRQGRRQLGLVWLHRCPYSSSRINAQTQLNTTHTTPMVINSTIFAEVAPGTCPTSTTPQRTPAP